jgi:hypothetical protein
MNVVYYSYYIGSTKRPHTEDKKMNKYDAEIARIMKLAAPHLINSEKGFTVANFSGTEDQFEYFASLFQDAVFA